MSLCHYTPLNGRGDQMGKDMVETVAMILVIIGGLNWGLVGLLNMNVVELLFASVPILVQIVYVLVGISALYMLYGYFMKK